MVTATARLGSRPASRVTTKRASADRSTGLREIAAVDARQLEQVLDERSHPLGGRPDPLDVVPSFVRQPGRVVLDQRLAEPVDGPKGSAQVMRHAVSESLQLQVGCLQLAGPLAQPALEIGVRPHVLERDRRAVGQGLQDPHLHGRGSNPVGPVVPDDPDRVRAADWDHGQTFTKVGR